MYSLYILHIVHNLYVRCVAHTFILPPTSKVFASYTSRTTPTKETSLKFTRQFSSLNFLAIEFSEYPSQTWRQYWPRSQVAMYTPINFTTLMINFIIFLLQKTYFWFVYVISSNMISSWRAPWSCSVRAILSQFGWAFCAAARLGILYTMRERKINELNI